MDDFDDGDSEDVYDGGEREIPQRYYRYLIATDLPEDFAYFCKVFGYDPHAANAKDFWINVPIQSLFNFEMGGEPMTEDMIAAGHYFFARREARIPRHRLLQWQQRG